MAFPPAYAARFDPPASEDVLRAETPAHLAGIGRIELQIDNPLQSGTAFLVSRCHILTNAHTIVLQSEFKYVERLVEESETYLGNAVYLAFSQYIHEQTFGNKPSRELWFYVHRDAKNRFDPKRKIRVERVLIFNPQYDYALARLSECVEPDGSSPLRLPTHGEFQAVVDILQKGTSTRVFVAGYPGDRDLNFLSVSSCMPPFGIDKRPLDQLREMSHRCNTAHGVSGAPLFLILEQGRDAQPPTATPVLQVSSEKTSHRTANSGPANRILPIAIVTQGMYASYGATDFYSHNVGTFLYDSVRLQRKIDEDMTTPTVRRRLQR